MILLPCKFVRNKNLCMSLCNFLQCLLLCWSTSLGHVQIFSLRCSSIHGASLGEVVRHLQQPPGSQVSQPVHLWDLLKGLADEIDFRYFDRNGYRYFYYGSKQKPLLVFSVCFKPRRKWQIRYNIS
jgi:hypothetical protein